LKTKLGDVFASFETQALASGAIAQVHRATLKDGTEVAVKVRHPNAERLVYLDLKIMNWVAKQVLFSIR
jgi:predicted unusual protein kinase regulating ubiquinone biosynthesis (AarF/ABC1/UbiB family)